MLAAKDRVWDSIHHFKCTKAYQKAPKTQFSVEEPGPSVSGHPRAAGNNSTRNVAADDSESEEIELIQISHSEKEAGAGCPVDIDVEDSDAIKKNKLRCTWDVTRAVICMVVAGILSTVVIIEKVYVFFV